MLGRAQAMLAAVAFGCSGWLRAAGSAVSVQAGSGWAVLCRACSNTSVAVDWVMLRSYLSLVLSAIVCSLLVLTRL